LGHFWASQVECQVLAQGLHLEGNSSRRISNSVGGQARRLRVYTNHTVPRLRELVMGQARRTKPNRGNKRRRTEEMLPLLALVARRSKPKRNRLGPLISRTGTRSNQRKLVLDPMAPLIRRSTINSIPLNTGNDCSALGAFADTFSYVLYCITTISPSHLAPLLRNPFLTLVECTHPSSANPAIPKSFDFLTSSLIMIHKLVCLILTPIHFHLLSSSSRLITFPKLF